MSSPDFSRTLARWAALTPPIHSPLALKLAADAVTDTVGCMVAGSHDDTTVRVLAAARQFGLGKANVVGHAPRLSVSSAALVNGTAAHVYDYDDNFHPSAAHASAVLVPALLAVADVENCDGHALFDAYIVGLEVMGRIGEGVNFQHYELGWHATSTIGSIAAAAACARLLKVDAERMLYAISLGMSLSSGSKKQFGTMAKPLHAGLAAQHGVHAALLAQQGITANHEPIDGDWGFRDLFTSPDSPGFADAQTKIGSPLAIEEYGLMTKPHPCCASVHCTVDGVVALMQEHSLRPEQIARVDTYVPKMTVDHLVFPLPADEREARFSMHYGVGLAIVHGALRLSDFHKEAIGRPEITAWAERIHMFEEESVRAGAVTANVLEPARVELLLTDGRTVAITQRYAKGVLQNPMSQAERDAKMRDCTAGHFDPEGLEQLSACLRNLGTTPVRQLMGLLAGAA